MNMNILDFIEVWWRSVRTLLESAGVYARFERSTDDRPNPSCSLNLRRNDLEADLVVWESGEAELAVVEADGSVSQRHFDDLRNREDLDVALSKLTALAGVSA
jgi:hypothetical protein